MRLPSKPAEMVIVQDGPAASLRTICAAPVPRAMGQRLTPARVRGADCTAGVAESRARGSLYFILMRGSCLKAAGRVVGLVPRRSSSFTLIRGGGSAAPGGCPGPPLKGRSRSDGSVRGRRRRGWGPRAGSPWTPEDDVKRFPPGWGAKNRTVRRRRSTEVLGMS